MAKRLVGVNSLGIRVGEDHHNAKLTDAEVEIIRELRREGWSYDRLAVKFEVSKSLIRYISQYKLRGHVATQWRTVHVPD